MTMSTENLISVAAVINDSVAIELIEQTIRDYIDDNNLIPTASDVAAEFSGSDIAEYINTADVASHIDTSEIVNDIVDSISINEIAGCISVQDIADEIDYVSLGEAIRSRASGGIRRLSNQLDNQIDDKIYERIEKLEAFVESIGSIIDNYRKKA